MRSIIGSISCPRPPSLPAGVLELHAPPSTNNDVLPCIPTCIFYGGDAVSWVHRVELWKCIYDEKLNLITNFAYFRGCIATP